jgi:hypothetical protein
MEQPGGLIGVTGPHVGGGRRVLGAAPAVWIELRGALAVEEKPAAELEGLISLLGLFESFGLAHLLLEPGLLGAE